MAKRGRKPKGTIVVITQPEFYFDTTEEDAVVKYLNSNCQKEKNELFETTLQPAFYKMFEAITNKYSLHQPGEELSDTINDVVSEVIDKMAGFTPGKGKAYSYIGTICKRYLINKLKKTQREMYNSTPYDDVSSDLIEDERLSYQIYDNVGSDMAQIIKETTFGIGEMIINNIEQKLNDNEILVGKALVGLMENWDDLFANLGSNKFNKSSISLYLKEVTNLSTKDVKSAMRKFKPVYLRTKKEIL